MNILIDATTNGGYAASGTSKTFSHTCSGTNRLLVVGFFHGTSDTVTGVTYGGTAMTLIAKVQTPSDRWIYLYYLLNPATGANNVVMSASGSADWGGGAISYTGVKQTGQPDASTTNTGLNPATFATTLTTTVNNCRTVGFWRTNDDDGSLLTISPGVFRQNNVVGYYSMGDSNGGVSTGSNSLTITNDSPYGNIACIMASFAPVPAPTKPAFLYNFM